MTEIVTDRPAAVEAFVTGAGWGAASRAVLAGDASGRRFYRLQHHDRRAVLMDAGANGADQTGRFARVGRWLVAEGYSAPAILAENVPLGLLLVADLGDALVGRMVADDPGQELPLYEAAIAFLGDLGQKRPPDFVPNLDAAALGDLVRLTADLYGPAAGFPPAADLPELVAELCQPLDSVPKVLSLRDFHVENLVWLPERQGVARLGLLDFQDAVAAHPGYDVVSLTRDARRDVDPALTDHLTRLHAVGNGVDPIAFAADCARLGAQRSLRILGIFVRLGLWTAKPSYLDLMPRVWSYLQRDLAAPGMEALRREVEKTLPPPTPETIEAIRSQCTTNPLP